MGGGGGETAKVKIVRCIYIHLQNAKAGNFQGISPLCSLFFTVTCRSAKIKPTKWTCLHTMHVRVAYLPKKPLEGWSRMKIEPCINLPLGSILNIFMLHAEMRGAWSEVTRAVVKVKTVVAKTVTIVPKIGGGSMSCTPRYPCKADHIARNEGMRHAVEHSSNKVFYYAIESLIVAKNLDSTWTGIHFSAHCFFELKEISLWFQSPTAENSDP